MADTHRRTALLVGSEKVLPAIASLLGNGFTRAAAYSGSDARRRLLNGEEFALTVIKTPLPDEFGDDLALTLAERSMAVILLVSAEHFEEYADRMSGTGVIVVHLPIVRSVFAQSVEMAVTTHDQVAALRRENERLRSKLEEMRRICLAKCLLIEHEGMREPDAHRFIEKRAMDLRLSRADVATMVIAQYGNG